MKQKTYQVTEIKVHYSGPNSEIERPFLKTSADAVELLRDLYNPSTLQIQEQFIVLYLNQANQLMGANFHSVGGMTGTVADIRLILAIALKGASNQIIISHNHPSGNLQPSRADKELTLKLKESAALMDIKLLDHIIMAKGSCYMSFADEGII
jgi:DNA repair protein RadC